jgi:hypothetical protein
VPETSRSSPRLDEFIANLRTLSSVLQKTSHTGADLSVDPALNEIFNGLITSADRAQAELSKHCERARQQGLEKTKELLPHLYAVVKASSSVVGLAIPEIDEKLERLAERAVHSWPEYNTVPEKYRPEIPAERRLEAHDYRSHHPDPSPRIDPDLGRLFKAVEHLAASATTAAFLESISDFELPPRFSSEAHPALQKLLYLRKIFDTIDAIPPIVFGELPASKTANVSSSTARGALRTLRTDLERITAVSNHFSSSCSGFSPQVSAAILRAVSAKEPTAIVSSLLTLVIDQAGAKDAGGFDPASLASWATSLDEPTRQALVNSNIPGLSNLLKSLRAYKGQSLFHSEGGYLSGNLDNIFSTVTIPRHLKDLIGHTLLSKDAESASIAAEALRGLRPPYGPKILNAAREIFATVDPSRCGLKNTLISIFLSDRYLFVEHSSRKHEHHEIAKSLARLPLSEIPPTRGKVGAQSMLNVLKHPPDCIPYLNESGERFRYSNCLDEFQATQAIRFVAAQARSDPSLYPDLKAMLQGAFPFGLEQIFDYFTPEAKARRRAHVEDAYTGHGPDLSPLFEYVEWAIGQDCKSDSALAFSRGALSVVETFPELRAPLQSALEDLSSGSPSTPLLGPMLLDPATTPLEIAQILGFDFSRRYDLAPRFSDVSAVSRRLNLRFIYPDGPEPMVLHKALEGQKNPLGVFFAHLCENPHEPKESLRRILFPHRPELPHPFSSRGLYLPWPLSLHQENAGAMREYSR